MNARSAAMAASRARNVSMLAFSSPSSHQSTSASLYAEVSFSIT
jgi:hypothetical protein